MKQQLKSRGLVVASVAAVVGLVLAPVAVSAVTQSTTVTANIQSSIAITQSGNVSFDIIPVSGGAQSSGNHTVTVTTNHPTGYLMTLGDADATTVLTDGSNTIAAHTGTVASPTALANNTWGFAIATASMTGVTNAFDASYTNFTDQTSSTTKWAGITVSAVNIKSTTVAAGSGDATVVNYSAKADTTKPVGAYVDTVTYTATTH